jgi:hypothetical protein
LKDEDLRGQLEFEWLITRPYSRRWLSKLKPKISKRDQSTPPNHSVAEGKDSGLIDVKASVTSGSKQPHRKMSVLPNFLELQPLVVGGEASKVEGGEASSRRNTMSVSRYVTDKELEEPDGDRNGVWNASMWKRAAKVATGTDVTEEAKEFFKETTADFVDEYTGENLFHL